MPPATNTTCLLATSVGAFPYADTVDVSAAASPVDPTCEAGVEHTVWWTYTTPGVNTPIRIGFEDSQGWGTILAIYTGACGGLSEVICDESFPATYDFMAQAGITYKIAVSLYSGSVGAIDIQFTVDNAPSPSTPVLAASSTTGRTVTLTWNVLSDTDTVDIERSTDNVNWTVVATVGAFSPYTDRALSSETVYYHRMRGENTLGYGSYSNTTTTTTLADTVGIVQYAIAMGGTASFGRAVEQNITVSLNALPPMFQVSGVFQLWIETNQQQTQPGGPGTNLYSTAKLLLKYWTGITTVITDSADYVLETQYIDPTTEVQYTNLVNRIEIFAYTGSADTVTGTHAADGFIRVRLNNVTIFDITDIALGTTGTPGWSQVVLGPSGTFTEVTAPITQNGGMSLFYLGDELDGVGNIFSYDFSTMVDADLFPTTWFRRNGISGLDQGAPLILSGKLSDSAALAFQRGWISLNTPLTPTNIYTGSSVPPTTFTGIFVITPTAVPPTVITPTLPPNRHDTYNGDVEVKIPDPTIRTALLGE